VLRDGRRVLIAGYLVLAGALAYAASADRLVAAWGRLGVPALDRPFADTRAYTSLWSCVRARPDAFVADPCERLRLALNRPGWVESLAFLRLDSAVPLALAVVAVFAVCLLVVAGPLSDREALVYAAVVFSPSILLGVERGNDDLVVFSLLTVLLVTMGSRRAALRAVGYAALLVAALLKLYPIAAVVALLRRGRSALVGAAAVTLVFAVFVIATLDDLRTVARTMKQSTLLSYGAGVSADGLESALSIDRLAATTVAAAGLVVLLAVAVAAGVRVGFASVEPTDPASTRALDSFWIGASLYLSSFAVGHNFDYKLVVLVFTVPQLLRWASTPEPVMPHARPALGVLVATLWLSASVPVVPGLSDAWIDLQQRFPFDELLNWFLFAYLAAALVVTAPPWVRRLRLPVRRPTASPSGIS
jgi:Glycosyltransferase family 87